MPPAEPVTRRQLRHAQEQATTGRHRAQHRAAPVTPGGLPVAATAAPPAAPTTRRALREAERNAASRSARTRAAVGRSAGRRVARRLTPLGRPLPGQGPALGLVVAIAFVLGAVTSVADANADRAVRAAQADSLSAARQVRHEAHDAGGRAPFVGLAARAAAAHRATALALASSALAAADDAIVQAGGVVSAEKLDPLATAAAQLEELVSVASPSEGSPATAAPTPDETSPVTPTSAVAAAGLAATTAGEPTPPAATTPVGGDPSAAADGATAAGTTPPAVPGPAAPGTAESAQGGPSLSADVVASPALDVSTSDRLLAAAAQVIALVDDVRQTAQQVAAEQAAEAARVAAEQAAADELARKISAADAAPNGQIPADVLCPVSFDGRVLLRCDAAAALDQLDVAFRDRFGIDLTVTDSYRDYAGQVAARVTKGDLAATPGTSNHGRGLAVDLSGFGAVGQFDRPYYLWMAKHAADYGWHHPAGMGPGGSGPLEPWHWEYGTE